MNNDSFYTKNTETLCNNCLQNPHYLIIHKKTVSQLVALFLMVAFFIFAAGYFLGKKKLAEDFSHIVEQANFSDQINFALTSLYDQEPIVQASKEDSIAIGPELTEVKSELEKRETQILAHNVPESKTNEPAPKKYIAQLFGGNQEDVNKFAQSLSQRGITVEIRKRTSKTPKGKTIQWFQAVTQAYMNEADLKTLVARIQKLEKINNVSILERST